MCIVRFTAPRCTSWGAREDLQSSCQCWINWLSRTWSRMMLESRVYITWGVHINNGPDALSGVDLHPSLTLLGSHAPPLSTSIPKNGIERLKMSRCALVYVLTKLPISSNDTNQLKAAHCLSISPFDPPKGNSSAHTRKISKSLAKRSPKKDGPLKTMTRVK